MINVKQVKAELQRLYIDSNILMYYKPENLESNPLHLDINADMVINNLKIIKNLISLYINMTTQKSSLSITK